MKDLKGPDQRKTTVAVASQKNNAKQKNKAKTEKMCKQRSWRGGYSNFIKQNTSRNDGEKYYLHCAGDDEFDTIRR